EALADERLESPLLGIEGVGVDALLLQRSEHHRAALQRNGALGRAAAHEHGDLAEVARVHAAPPMILTSGTRSIRKRFATGERASAIGASISEARALPLGLTMKFACFSEMRAPPISRPFSPAASIRRAA